MAAPVVRPMTERLGLTLEQAPPLSVPLRFFLTAPVFAIGAGATLFALGPSALASRWSTDTMALTHLLTLGFITMVMLGALFQMLPVLSGHPFPRSRLFAGLVHGLLSLGTLALAGGLLRQQPELTRPGLILLATSLIVFVAAIGWALSQVWVRNATITAMRLSVVALLFTIGLAFSVGATRGWGFTLAQHPRWVNAHLAWGLLGWVGILVIGVAFQVVPMFQVTPDYPTWVRRYLPWTLFLGLLAWSSRLWINRWEGVYVLLEIGLAAGFALFAAVTLDLLRRRRRRLPDATLWYWRLAMLNLLICAGLWAAARFWPDLDTEPSASLLLGILVLIGVIQSVINGMLYKIAPFLVWFHLRGLGAYAVSNMKEVLPEKIIQRQFWAHFVALMLLVGAVYWPSGVYLAALAYAASSLMLGLNLAVAMRVYLRGRRQG